MLSSDDEGEKDMSRASSKITTWPLTLPQWMKVELSDFALNGNTSSLHKDDTTSHHMGPLPHHHIVVKVEPTIIDLTMSDEEDDVMPALMTGKHVHSSRSSISLSPSLSPSPSPHSSPNETDESSDDSLPAWPAEFYVVDIIQGFEKCDEAHCG